MTYSQQLAAIAAAADAEIASLTATVALRDATIAALRAAAAPAPAFIPLANPGSPVATQAWKAVWGDEFTGTAVDPAKWSTGRWSPTTTADEPWNHTAGASNLEGAYMATSQVSVAGGCATLSTKTAPRTINGVAYPTASGMLQSAGHYAMAPGQYLEARVKVPKATGVWPAFWLLPMPVNTWPPETDIFEMGSGLRPEFNYHPTSKVPPQSGPDAYGEAGIDYRDAFHVYGLHWSSTGFLTPYLDGKPYSVRQATVDPRPMYVLLNLSTHAGPQPPDGTSMVIDWVRAWSPT